MARINIEDSIYQDIRFHDLTKRLDGGIDAALGALVRAWSLAQKWYLKNDRTIPFDEWTKCRLPKEIIEVGLASLIDDSVRMAGADQHFAWLIQKSEAGKKSVNARSTHVQHTLTHVDGRRAHSLPLVLTPTLTKTLALAEEGGMGETVVAGDHADYEPYPQSQASPRQRQRPASPRGALEILKGTKAAEELLATVTQRTQDHWVEAYPDTEWLKTEISKAAAWVEANPKKRPKTYGAFLSNWFSRGWEDHRKRIPSVKPENGESSLEKYAKEMGYIK